MVTNINQIGERSLWLAFERLPHPDAVSYSASEDDVRQALDLLRKPERERVAMAGQLANYLRDVGRQPAWERPAIPVRTQSGLFRLVSWRFAKWLSKACLCSSGAIERTVRQLEQWLDHEREQRPIVGMNR